jgi:hypothetical protein
VRRVRSRSMRSGRDATTELRRAISALPVRTREAMLDGIRANPIVVGAYTDSDGGICPMLAAHRHGGRTTLLAFARSWDRFAGARRVRRATRRELATLERFLELSLLDAPDVDLGAAIAEHAQLKERYTAGRTFPELEAKRLRDSDAERALARLDVHVRELASA